MRENISNLEEEYIKIYPDLERFKKAILDQIENLLEENQVPLGFPIQSRTKSWNSIVEKVESGRFNIKKSIEELQDLVGVRVILLFNRDVEKVCEILKDNLEVIKQYDTSEKLKDDQFGYSSIHFISKIPDNWKNVPTLKGMEKHKIEIQVRTLSQHSWAEASNQLQYKQENNVPRELLRSIGRVSALLETVDLEFERLLNEREKYKAILNKDEDNSENPILDVDILEIILDRKLPHKNKIQNEDFSRLIDDLRIFGIERKKELENLIDKYYEEALENDRKHTERFPIKTHKKNAYYTFTGLIRIMCRIDQPKVYHEIFIKHLNKNKAK